MGPDGSPALWFGLEHIERGGAQRAVIRQARMSPRSASPPRPA